jgi:hypothetical protein
VIAVIGNWPLAPIVLALVAFTAVAVVAVIEGRER